MTYLRQNTPLSTAAILFALFAFACIGPRGSWAQASDGTPPDVSPSEVYMEYQRRWTQMKEEITPLYEEVKHHENLRHEAKAERLRQEILDRLDLTERNMIT
jgi:hypothetical protein